MTVVVALRAVLARAEQRRIVHEQAAARRHAASRYAADPSDAAAIADLLSFADNGAAMTLSFLDIGLPSTCYHDDIPLVAGPKYWEAIGDLADRIGLGEADAQNRVGAALRHAANGLFALGLVDLAGRGGLLRNPGGDIVFDLLLDAYFQWGGPA